MFYYLVCLRHSASRDWEPVNEVLRLRVRLRVMKYPVLARVVWHVEAWVVVIQVKLVEREPDQAVGRTGLAG